MFQRGSPQHHKYTVPSSSSVSVIVSMRPAAVYLAPQKSKLACTPPGPHRQLRLGQVDLVRVSTNSPGPTACRRTPGGPGSTSRQVDQVVSATRTPIWPMTPRSSLHDHMADPANAITLKDCRHHPADGVTSESRRSPRPAARRQLGKVPQAPHRPSASWRKFMI